MVADNRISIVEYTNARVHNNPYFVGTSVFHSR